MTKSLQFLILAVLYANIILSQSDSAILSKVDDILKQIKELKGENVQRIGYVKVFGMSDRKYSLYNSQNINIQNRKIDSVSMVIKDGFIVDIKVFSVNAVFINGKAPIALSYSRFQNNKKDKLFDRTGNYVVAQEILFLSLDNNFIPEDGKAVLKIGNDNYQLKRSVGINTIFDIRIYSDALGLIGSQPNALAQTDLRLKQFLHRKNLHDQGKFVFQYFKAFVNVSKFDSKDRYIDSADYSRTKLIQKSYASADFAFNAINGWLAEKKSANIYYADFGGGVNLARLSKTHDSIETILPYWFIEAGINFRSSDNIGLDFYIRYNKSYFARNNFTYDGRQMEFFNIGTEVFFNPMEDRSSRFFARINYTVSTTKKEQKDGFIKLQLGYSVLLTKLLDKK